MKLDMKRIALIALLFGVLLGVLLGCLVPQRPEPVVLDRSVPDQCSRCITCDYADLPLYTYNRDRFTIMRLHVQAVLDSAYAAGDTATSLVFLRECRTITCDIAMVALIRFQDGNSYLDIDCTVVNPIDTTITGMKSWTRNN